MKFEITAVRTLAFAVHAAEAPAGLSTKDVNFSIGIQTQLSDARDVIKVRCDVALEHGSALLAELSSEIAYHVFEMEVREENSKLGIPSWTILLLTSIALSTSRGLLAAKGSGTFLDEVPLPVVDPKQLVGDEEWFFFDA